METRNITKKNCQLDCIYDYHGIQLTILLQALSFRPTSMQTLEGRRVSYQISKFHADNAYKPGID